MSVQGRRFGLTTVPYLSIQILADVVIVFENKKGVRSSGLMILLWMSLIAYGTLKLRTLILLAEDLVSKNTSQSLSVSLSVTLYFFFSPLSLSISVSLCLHSIYLSLFLCLSLSLIVMFYSLGECDLQVSIRNILCGILSIYTSVSTFSSLWTNVSLWLLTRRWC